MRTSQRTGAHGRRGSVAIAALFAVIVLLALSSAMLSTSLRTNDERTSAVRRHGATYTANSGIAHAVINLANGVDTDIGSVDQYEEFGQGSYFVELIDNGDGSYTANSFARVGTEREGIEAVIAPAAGGVYTNALFAGNSSGDTDYTLELGGLGAQADQVNGDIYSGNDVDVTGDADVTGTIRAGGDITGASGEGGVSQPLPDIAAMDYPNTADFDVASLFAGATYQSDAAGGSAWQVAEENPAHIFRKNPSDRSTETSGTAKDDYFLEDPYESVSVDSSQDGSDAYEITLSGIGGEPGTDSNQSVFFIDGNLWVHNKKTFSFILGHDVPNGVQVTFVVSGNVYFSDNLFYGDPAVDGVAFIAINDANEPDSGNIYFGDPEFGTLTQMNAFMYAENNFHDVNLDEDGSTTVTVHGNMTAGNQVVIERDYGDQHTKLTVDFDDRIALGDLDMPGLPRFSGADVGAYSIVSWRPIAIDPAIVAELQN